MNRASTIVIAFLTLEATAWSQPARPKPAPTAPAATRTEHDLLGKKQVPADAFYGVQTARALENFQISGEAIN